MKKSVQWRQWKKRQDAALRVRRGIFSALILAICGFAAIDSDQKTAAAAQAAGFTHILCRFAFSSMKLADSPISTGAISYYFNSIQQTVEHLIRPLQAQPPCD
jgi:hypothetical protein